MSLVVQKFGGTSVANLERIENVARRVAKTFDDGNDVAVILSAMSGVTDGLISLARQVTEMPDKRELDVLLATGEQTTAALLAMNLKSKGYSAQSLLGFQAQVKTDCAFGNARILDIDAERIKELIRQRYIVVIAGFQGCDAQGNITTLGRGGSDTSAVAIAAALKADTCEIYTDVDGVYTADPNVCKKARKLNKIAYDEMLEMASIGAKVLQIRSVEFAKKYNVAVHVRSSFNEEVGTMVVNEEPNMERVVVTGVTTNKNEARITLKKVPDQPGIAAKIFTPICGCGDPRGYDYSEYPLRRTNGPDIHGRQNGFQSSAGNRKKGRKGNRSPRGSGRYKYRQSLRGRGGDAKPLGCGIHHVFSPGQRKYQHFDDQHIRNPDLLCRRGEICRAGSPGPSHGLWHR